MNIKLVKSKLEDSKFLYNLRNSFEIRTVSKNKKKISLKDHRKWFSYINKSKNFLFIIIYKSKKIGYIRTKKEKKNYFVSIGLLKKFTSKGIGKKSLLKFEKKTKIKNFFAHVLKKNVQSLYFFFSCNYYIERETKNLYIMKKNQQRKNFNKIINDIEKIRKKNNSNWMDILRVAFKFSPKETAKIMSQIYQQDNKISKLSKKLKSQI